MVTMSRATRLQRALVVDLGLMLLAAVWAAADQAMDNYNAVDNRFSIMRDMWQDRWVAR